MGDYQQKNTPVPLQMALVNVGLTTILSSTSNSDIQNLPGSKELQLG